MVSTMASPMLNLRDTLKAATAADHAALERTGVLRAFSNGGTSPEAYADYLLRQWQLHHAMEPSLRGCFEPGWAQARLVKAQWLLQDLAILGCDIEVGEVAWDPPQSAAEAMGALYVLDGATLGIRHSVRSLPVDHPAHGPANRFIQGYGEHTGARWKDLVARLEEIDPVLWPDVVAGARAVFSAFERHFSGLPHADFTAFTAGRSQPHPAIAGLQGHAREL
jgi:heme oxygenase